MKAIILAGGSGSRLYPLTQVMNKQLQAVYDKPMIYYPLTILMASGIRDYLIISGPCDLLLYRKLLGDGSQWGISISYAEQAAPRGIAEAFLIGEDFIGTEPVTLMLGDNIFSGGDDFPRAMKDFKSGATVFAYHVKNPQDYGVVEFDSTGKAISIEEKPKQPRSHYAVPGIYIYDRRVINYAKELAPSHRGELEITDINQRYLVNGELEVRRLSRGFVWLDAGTSSNLHDASHYIATIERRQGVKVGCPEEAAFIRSFINRGQLENYLKVLPESEYTAYLKTLLT